MKFILSILLCIPFINIKAEDFPTVLTKVNTTTVTTTTKVTTTKVDVFPSVIQRTVVLEVAAKPRVVSSFRVLCNNVINNVGAAARTVREVVQKLHPGFNIDLDHNCNKCGTYSNIINRHSGDLHSHVCPKCGNEWWHPNPEAMVKYKVTVAPTPKLVNTTVSSTSVRWSTSYNLVSQQAETTKKPVLIFFTDPSNCAPCRALEGGALSNSSVINLLNNDFVCLKVSVGTSEGSRLARLFNVTGWPRLMIYKSGKFVNSHFGNTSTEEMVRFLNNNK